jgi:hypothetical protein
MTDVAAGWQRINMKKTSACILCPRLRPSGVALEAGQQRICLPALEAFARHLNVEPAPNICDLCTIQVNEYECQCCGKLAVDVFTHVGPFTMFALVPKCMCGRPLHKECEIHLQNTEDFEYILNDAPNVGFYVCCPACVHYSLAVNAARRRYVDFRNAYFAICLGCPSNIIHSLWTLAWPKSTVKACATDILDQTTPYFSTTLNRWFEPPARR